MSRLTTWVRARRMGSAPRKVSEWPKSRGLHLTATGPRDASGRPALEKPEGASVSPEVRVSTPKLPYKSVSVIVKARLLVPSGRHGPSLPLRGFLFVSSGERGAGARVARDRGLTPHVGLAVGRFPPCALRSPRGARATAVPVPASLGHAWRAQFAYAIPLSEQPRGRIWNHPVLSGGNGLGESP